MSKSNTQIVKGNAGENLPAFLQTKQVVGVDNLQDYIVLPRLKVVQKSAEGTLRDLFGVGDVILVPQNILVSPCGKDERGNPKKAGESFLVVPLFFFPSWGTINDLKLKGKEPMFLKQTINPADPLVQKCKNPATWEENHPTAPGMKVRNVEMLNFVLFIQRPDLDAQPVIATFAKAEWMSGSNWASLIKLTKRSIFARQWELTSTYRPGSGKGDWYGFNVKQPDDPTAVWVTDEQRYSSYEKLSLELAEQHRTRGLSADMSDGEVAAEPVAGDPSKSEY